MDAQTAKTIQTLTNKSIRAHAAYRTAAAANRQPIQSPREVRANEKYQALKTELDALCREAGIPTPRPGTFTDPVKFVTSAPGDSPGAVPYGKIVIEGRGDRPRQTGRPR